MDKKWKRFEDLAAHIQRTLSPAAVVEQNVRVRGKISGADRQIDIAVRAKAGQFDLFIVIDCKDYAVKVDVKDMESFVSMLKDVEANKGALIAANGFTESAKRVAKDSGISLYSLVDAESEDWPSFIAIPVLVDDRHLQAVQYMITSSKLCSFRFDDIENVSIFRQDGSRIGPLRDLVSSRWNEGQLPFEAGLHKCLALSAEPTYLREDGRLALVELKADIVVKRTLYFGHLPLVKVQGLHDAHTGDFHTRSMTTDWMDVETARATWKVLQSEDELAVTPVMSMVEVTYFPLEGENAEKR